jgi:hypothetical protein
MAGENPPLQNARLDDVDPEEVEDQRLPEDLDDESTEE